mgnify:FL=1
MAVCKKCGRELTRDEIGVTKRLISRTATEFLCVDCLADYFQCGKSVILDRIRYYKEMGCTLFSSL